MALFTTKDIIFLGQLQSNFKFFLIVVDRYMWYIYGAWPLPYTSIYKQGGPDYPQFYSEAQPFMSNLTSIEIKVDYNISEEVHSQIFI